MDEPPVTVDEPPLIMPDLPPATAIEPPAPRRPLRWTLIVFVGLVIANYGGLILVTGKILVPKLVSYSLGGAAEYAGWGMVATGAAIVLLGILRAMSTVDGLWVAPPRLHTWLPGISWVLQFIVNLVQWAFVFQWRAIDAETPARPVGKERHHFDPAILVIMVVCAVSLTLQEYIGDRGMYNHWFPVNGNDRYYELKSFAWWAGWRVLGYLIIPILVVLILPGQRLRDYHISPREFFKKLPIYAVLFLLILPAVIAASGTKSFQHTYPFYKWANRSTFDLVAWECMYAAQFLSLEFFFRGFMLQGLRSRMGSNAIFMMIVPYCMIHYGKPLPETMGAIGAGLILGTLAMRTRSIWGGVLIHIAVAVTMDVLALRVCPSGGRPCGW